VSETASVSRAESLPRSSCGRLRTSSSSFHLQEKQHGASARARREKEIWL